MNVRLTVIIGGFPAMAEGLQRTGHFKAVIPFTSTSGLRDSISALRDIPKHEVVFLFTDRITVDTPQTLEFLAQGLAGRGYRVVMLGTGAGARTIAERYPGTIGLVDAPFRVNTILGALSGLPGVGLLPACGEEWATLPLDADQPFPVVAPLLPRSVQPADLPSTNMPSGPTWTETPAPTPGSPAWDSAPAPSPATAWDSAPAPTAPGWATAPAPSPAAAWDSAPAPSPAPSPTPAWDSAPAPAAPGWDTAPAPAWDSAPATAWDSAPAPAWDSAPAAPGWDSAPAAPGWDSAPAPSAGWDSAPAPTASGWDTAPAPSPATAWDSAAAPTASGWDSAPAPSPAAAWDSAPAPSPAPAWDSAPAPATGWEDTTNAATGWDTAPAPTTGWTDTNAPATNWGPTTDWNGPHTNQNPQQNQYGTPDNSWLEERQRYGGRRGFVIVFTAPSGGVGKSTVSTNLAAYMGLRLQSTNKTVALVDTNVQNADVGKILGKLTPTVVDVASNQNALTLGNIQQNMIYRRDLNLSVLLGPPSPEMASPAYINGKLYRDVVNELRKGFDYIVVDTSVSDMYHDVFMNFVIPEMDFMVLIAIPNYGRLVNIDQWATAVTADRHAGGYGVDPRKIAYMLNQAKDGVDCSESDVREELASWAYLGKIPDSIEWERAVNNNELVANKNFADLHSAFDEILYRVTGEEVFYPQRTTPERRNPLGSLFGKLKKKK